MVVDKNQSHLVDGMRRVVGDVSVWSSQICGVYFHEGHQYKHTVNELINITLSLVDKQYVRNSDYILHQMIQYHGTHSIYNEPNFDPNGYLNESQSMELYIIAENYETCCNICENIKCGGIGKLLGKKVFISAPRIYEYDNFSRVPDLSDVLMASLSDSLIWDQKKQQRSDEIKEDIAICQNLNLNQKIEIKLHAYVHIDHGGHPGHSLATCMFFICVFFLIFLFFYTT